MLADDFYGARMSAYEALIKYDPMTVTESLIPVLPELKGYAMNLGCQLLAQTRAAKAVSTLIELSQASDPQVRSYASVALIQADPENKTGFHQRLLDNESDRLNLLKLKGAR